MNNSTHTPSQLYKITKLDQYIISEGGDQSDLDNLFGDLKVYNDGFYSATEVDAILLEDQGREFVSLVQSTVPRLLTFDC